MLIHATMKGAFYTACRDAQSLDRTAFEQRR